jgi:hypothetical protein
MGSPSNSFNTVSVHMKWFYIQSFPHFCNRQVPEKHCINEKYINENLVFHIVELSNDKLHTYSRGMFI